MSPIIYEVLDVGTGVTDGEGRLVSSGAGIPSFIGVLDKAVQKIIEIHQGSIRDGDVFITNDPNFGGVTHLNDIIRVNSRLPDFAHGDLWAQLAASFSAEKHIQALFSAYGSDAVQKAVSSSFEAGKSRSLQGLAKLTNGRFEIEEEQDDGAIWRAAITISDDEFVVDLTGNPPEMAAPYNTSRDGAIVSAQMIFKALCDPERFTNFGSFQPLKVLTDPGSIFHAGPTAPHAYYFETRIRLIDMLWQCLAQAMPNRLPAGSFSSIFGTVIAGIHPDTGRKYTLVEPQMGGWGATSDGDGQNAMFSTSHGDTFNCPVEICEARYGLDVVHKSLATRLDNDADNKGGLGVSLLYELRANATLSVGYTRAIKPVWSLNNSEPGGKNSMRIIRADGTNEKHQFASDIHLDMGDRILIETASGGNT